MTSPLEGWGPQRVLGDSGRGVAGAWPTTTGGPAGMKGAARRASAFTDETTDADD